LKKEAEQASSEVVKKDNETEIAEQKYRQKVIKEVVDTERVYVQVLEDLVHTFIPLCKVDTSLMSPGEFVDVFGNIDLISKINKQLLGEFEKRLDLDPESKKDNVTALAEIFLEQIEYFKPYHEYCVNSAKSLETLESLCRSNAGLSKLIEKWAMQRKRDIIEVLVRPIQRLTRYHLLIKETVKHTPKDAPGYEKLRQAFKKVASFATSINDAKRLADNFQRMLEVQRNLMDGDEIQLVAAHRRLIREGPLVEIRGSKSTKESYFFLFNDILVITRQKKAAFKLKHKISMRDVTVRNIADTPQFKNVFEIVCSREDGQMCDPPKCYRVFPKTDMDIDKIAWYADLELLVSYISIKKQETASVPTVSKATGSASGNKDATKVKAPKVAKATIGQTLKPEDEKIKQNMYKVGEDEDLGRSVFHIWKQGQLARETHEKEEETKKNKTKLKKKKER